MDVALMDRVNYINTDGDHVTAYRGEEVKDAKNRDRLVELGAIGSEDDLAATEAAGRPMLAAEVEESERTAAELSAAASDEAARVAQMQSSTGAPAEDPLMGSDAPPTPEAAEVEEVPEGEAAGDERPKGRRR